MKIAMIFLIVLWAVPCGAADLPRLNDQFTDIGDNAFKLEHTATRNTIVGDSESESFEPVVEIIPWSGDCLRVWKDTQASISPGVLLEDKSRLIWQDSREKYTFSPASIDQDDKIPVGSDVGTKFTLRITNKPKIDLDGYARFTFKMSGFKDFTFVIQGPLTPDDIAQGCVRPEHVLESIAVYHKTKRNNDYQTGKVCHIYRPWCRDSLGNFTWGKWEYDLVAGTLTKAIPKEAFDFVGATWWDIDATFGNTGQGESQYFSQTTVWAVDITSGGGDAGTATKLWGYFYNTKGFSRTLEIGLMEDAPGEPVAGEAGTTINASSADQNLSVDVSGDAYGIIANTTYWIGCKFSGDETGVYYDENSVFNKYNNAWDATWSTSGSHTKELSMYVEYTAAAGLSIPIAMHHYMHH